MHKDGIIIFGASGLLGAYVHGILGRNVFTQRVYAPSRAACDLSLKGAADALITFLRPSIVINCAGMTDVDACESNYDLADRINSAAVHEMAEACRKIGARFVHMSSDFVFSGNEETPAPHHFTAEPAVKIGRDAVGVYARTKAHGEAYAAICPNHCIIRTSWLFGSRLDKRKTYPEWFVDQVVGSLQILKSGDALPKPIPLLTDRQGSPTYAADAAQAVVLLAQSPWIGSAHVCNGSPSDMVTAEAKEKLGFTSSQEDFGSYAIRTFGDVQGGWHNPLFAEVAKNFAHLFSRMPQQHLVDEGIWKVLRPKDTRLIPSELGGFVMRPFDEALKAFWKTRTP
jgi:dTDP-4-dehydrorhamnose reductase